MFISGTLKQLHVYNYGELNVLTSALEHVRTDPLADELRKSQKVLCCMVMPFGEVPL